jgi:hypothetical protein
MFASVAISTPLSEKRSFRVIGTSHSFGRNAAMMRKQQQYRTSDYKCALLDL